MSKIESTQLAATIGRIIAKRRQAIHLTQEQVAENLDIGSEAVSRIERGSVMPTVQRLLELADLFQCPVADLLTETSTRPTDQAQYLYGLLAPLKESDREMIIAMVEQLTIRLVKE